LRETSPRKMVNTSYNSSNRFTALSGNSQSRSQSRNRRNRSTSNRRKGPPVQNQQNTQQKAGPHQKPGNFVPKPPPPPNMTMEQDKYTIVLDSHDYDKCNGFLITLANTINDCSKKIKDPESDLSEEQTEIFTGIINAIGLLGKFQDVMFQNIKKPKIIPEDPPRDDPSTQMEDEQILLTYADMVQNGEHAKSWADAAQPSVEETIMVDLTDKATVRRMTQKPQQNQHAKPPEDPRKKKFREAVKDAEKSTLVFNLDMGRFPIMNQETMSTKATLALSSMAAAKEGGGSTIPSEEARDTIEDVIGLIKGVTFYGKQTKSYKAKNDPKSGSFCTVPVRYDFKDKDTRIRAEKILKDRCDINCSTPYPLILRECIKQALVKVKNEFPRDKVRVSVDAANCALKIAKKKVDGQVYHPYPHPIPLPEEVFDIGAKKLPEGFRFDFVLKLRTISEESPPSKEKTPEPSPRQSRKENFERQSAEKMQITAEIHAVQE